MKKNLPRLLMFLSGIFLLMLFVYPMWQITLIAAQYPEGVTMYIWINKLGGETPATIQNINILNHYVGMEYIKEESFPELKYFPYIVIVMSVLAILFAWLNNRKLFLLWAVIMIVLATAGLYDFYLWEYAYGHNLSPDAPIKVPGASFQPPLFGSKNILNFVAKSYPHIGGYFAGFSILTAALAWRMKCLMDKKSETKDAPEITLTQANFAKS